MYEMDLEGLWKHTLQHLLLSVMFCFGAGCVGLCFVTQLSARYVFVMVLAVFVTSLFLSVCFFFSGSLLFYIQRFEHVFVFFITLLSLLFRFFLFQCYMFLKRKFKI